MKEVFEISGAILFSLGGGTTIIFGLSKWLGELWASRIIEKEKVQHQKAIDEYKCQLEISINRFNSINEKIVHISKAQYDKEFEIYLEIWGKLDSCIMHTINLYPKLDEVPVDENDKEELYKERYSKYCEMYNIFSLAINKYAPFYNEDFYKLFLDIRTLCSNMGSIFKYYKFDLKYNALIIGSREEKMDKDDREKVYIKIPKELSEKKEELQNGIRDYLKKLRIAGN